MSNPMSGDQNVFDKAKEAGRGLKDKLTGKGQQKDPQAQDSPDEVPPPEEAGQAPPPGEQPYPPQ